MIILINLISIKSGGGQQVASSFVMQSLRDPQNKFYYLVTKGTYLNYLLSNFPDSNYFEIERGIFNRIIFILFRFRRTLKRNSIDGIYTLFGPGIQIKNYKSITGCAYSNLFFPEIDFWKSYPLREKLIKKLIDKYRLLSILKSNAIIFENRAMEERAWSIYNYPASQTILILPSVSTYNLDTKDLTIQKKLSNISSSDFNMLMLTGWHKNKNIELVPFILKQLNLRNIWDVKFVISVSESEAESKKLKATAKDLGVAHQIIFLGKVHPTEIGSVYKRVDGVMLLSLLESFSNNIIEAWYFNKPLFISDQEWARSICDSAAIYVNRTDPNLIAEKIVEYRNSAKIQKKIAKRSKEILQEYPTPQEKYEMQINYIRKILNE